MLVDIPLLNPRKLSYKRICEQAASAIAHATLADEPLRMLAVDFPPDRAEQRAGTLVSRYEHNLNMCQTILEELGVVQDSWTAVGTGTVDIRDNINPQGGGPYLSDDECLVGFRAPCPKLDGKYVTILLNAGVDKATLTQVKDLDKGERDVIVLVNCNLSSLSFFDKLGKKGFAKYIEQFSSIYYLHLFLGIGMLFKCSPDPWSAWAQRDDGAVLLEEFQSRPEIFKVEELLRRNIG